LEVVYVIAKRGLKVSPKFFRMSEIYRHFSEPWAHLCDFSDEARHSMYRFESRGTPLPPYSDPRRLNGYQLGKHWMDVTVAMWKDDLAKGLLFRQELYSEPCYPHWWLDLVLPPRY
jgi:hypothetical protein